MNFEGRLSRVLRDQRSVFVAALVTIVSVVASVHALAGDIVVQDGPLSLEEDDRTCNEWVDWPKPHYYTTRAVTFSFDLLAECEPGDIKYDIELTRSAGQGTFEILLGQGEPNWSRNHYVGLCPGPCSSINLVAEHPWHETADYYFKWAIQGPPHPEYGGAFAGDWGSGSMHCSTNGITASCGEYRTAHIPDSVDDVPTP